MGIVTEAAKKSRDQGVILVEIESQGKVFRFATQDVAIPQFEELLDNGGFELDSGVSDVLTPTSNVRSTTQVYSDGGKYSRQIIVDAEHEGVSLSGGTQLEKGTTYRIRKATYGDGTNKAYNRILLSGGPSSYSPLSANAAGYIYPAQWTVEEWEWLCTECGLYVTLLQSGIGMTAGTWYSDANSISEVKPDIRFDGRILSISEIGHTLSFSGPSGFAYARKPVSITIANSVRMQDDETHRVLDGSPGCVYLWYPWMTWEQTQADGMLYAGVFRKDRNTTDETYKFSIVDPKRLFSTVPAASINDQTFPNHRKDPAINSVSGKAQPQVYGEISRGVQLLCVDTTTYTYMPSSGVLGSAEPIYDKNGTVVSDTNYSIVNEVDGVGNLVTLVRFTADQGPGGTDLEPFHCQVSGLQDQGGEFTGTAGATLEHPADIAHGLAYNNATGINFNYGSFRTMRNVLAGMKFGMVIRSKATADEILNRIFVQTLTARADIHGEVGVITPNIHAPAIGKLTERDHVGGDIEFTKTPDNLICNKITAKYRASYASGSAIYEGELTRDWTNNLACKSSQLEYGIEYPEVLLRLPDIQSADLADYMINRYLGIFSHRHDLVRGFEARISDGYGFRVGDVVEFSHPDGSSIDGEGFYETPVIVMEKIIDPTPPISIRFLFWRVRVNMDYGREVVSAGEDIGDGLGGFLEDGLGGRISDGW